MIPNGVSLPCETCRVQVPLGRGLLAPNPWRVFCLDHVPDTATRAVIKSVSQRLKDWRDGELAPYQIQGAYWLAARKAAILGDEQGLGKTVQAISAIPKGESCLVICPKIAKGVWLDHFKELRPDLKANAVIGTGVKIRLKPGQVAIMNFDIIGHKVKDYQGIENVIVDECHYLKNKRTNRSINTRSICWDVMTRGGRVFFLSGTPIKNSPDDLWSLLTTLKLSAKAFKSRRNFRELFGGKKGRFGLEWKGKVDEDVPRILRHYMLRRHKVDVLPELPERRYEKIQVDIPGPELALCDEVLSKLKERKVKLEDAIATALKNNNSIDFLTMSRVCKALANAKLKSLLKYLDQLESAGDVPLLVWSRHVDPLEVVGNREGWKCLHGGTSEFKRGVIEKQFQRGELRGLAVSIKAGGTALTLTKSAHSIFLDFEWSPADNEQARDRNHRIGQERRVLYTYLIADHILDRRMADILTTKNDLIDAVVRAAAVKVGKTETQNELF